ncbi:methyl-accepting chemotaxis protein [Agrobacterium fabrum]|uniref:methyl-accepting chemotaxis protein n=1 Tax=Agrobacterium fabrum TaxID=1176649 RepID=UPI001571BDDF|nr:methyl-accepting chemotaxis protein [Agrobacterium fabrum]WCK80090.1 methyl-accepting chemotaxis protein [Agrobacterium fabrum]
MQYQHRVGLGPLSIKTKFATVVIGATLISCSAVGLLSYEIGKTGLIEASKLRLSAIARNEAKTLETYAKRVDQTLVEISQNTAVGEMANSASMLLNADKEVVRRVFQDRTKTMEERASYDGADQNLTYAVKYSGVHSALASSRRNAGVSDILVLDKAGSIIYTVVKGNEFNTAIDDAQNSPLQPFYKEVMAGGDDQIHASGFRSYPSEEAVISAFVSKPLAVSVWGNVERRGTIMVRIAAEKLTDLLALDGAIESVDDAFLLSEDGAVRAGQVGRGGVAEAVRKARLSQKPGSLWASTEESRNFYSYQPITLFGEKHLLVVGQKETSILASANELAFWAVLVTVAVLVLMGVAGFYISSRLTRPIGDLAGLMNRLNNGETDIVVDAASRCDEVGAMGRALESFRESAIEKGLMEVEARTLDLKLDAERNGRDIEKARNAKQLEDAVSLLAEGLQRLSVGDLSKRITTPFVPSLDGLRTNFNHSVEQLETTVKNIAGSADFISGGSAGLKASSEDLARRTERQAVCLEEAAAALGEVTELVAQSMQRCETTVAVVTDARDRAQASTLVVDDATAAMRRIQESSSKVIHIIDVIEQIAFQTNLLALNAGVEAARAGEAGKGFAVVAQEVRELAQRSSHAARDIGGLIGKSTSDVQEGVLFVGKTRESLLDISDCIRDVTDHISAIAAAARDQSSRVKSINASVSDLDQVTQRNAAMVEETTASAFALSHEADSLNEQVRHFLVQREVEESPRAVVDAA